MSIKKTKRVLGAKVEVTKKDARKVSPLTRYWENRLNQDNWYVLGLGVFIGFTIGLIV